MKEWGCFVFQEVFVLKSFRSFCFLFHGPQSSLKAAPRIDIRLLLNCNMLVSDAVRLIRSGYNYYLIR